MGKAHNIDRYGEADAVVLAPDVAGGLSHYRNIDLGITGQVVKAGPGQVYAIQISNNSAAKRFVRLYNLATAPSATDPPVMTLLIHPNTTEFFAYPIGVQFSAGISCRASNAVADNDATATTANDVLVNIAFK